MAHEIWKKIRMPGICPIYYVSNLGRVKSIGHYDRFHIYRPTTIKRIAKNVRGYERVHLRFKNKHDGQRIVVHRLVANAFIPNPHNYRFVCHYDGLMSDNRASNLCWRSNPHHSNHHVKQYSAKYWKQSDSWKPIVVYRNASHGRAFSSITKAAKAMHQEYRNHTIHQWYTSLLHTLNNPEQIVYGKFTARYISRKARQKVENKVKNHE